LLVLGWLGSRLGWRPAGLRRRDGAYHGVVRAGARQIQLELAGDPNQTTPGITEIALVFASGTRLSLRGTRGGLRARRTDPDGSVSEWTAWSAPSDEAQILAEGIRRALLSDRAYRPALEHVSALLPCRGAPGG